MHQRRWIKGGFTYANIIGKEGHVLNLIDEGNPFASYYAFKDEIFFSAYLEVVSDKFTTGKAFITNQTNQVVGFTERKSNGYLVFLPNYPRNRENDSKFEEVIKHILKEHDLSLNRDRSCYYHFNFEYKIYLTY